MTNLFLTLLERMGVGQDKRSGTAHGAALARLTAGSAGDVAREVLVVERAGPDLLKVLERLLLRSCRDR